MPSSLRNAGRLGGLPEHPRRSRARESRPKWAKMDFARYARECVAGKAARASGWWRGACGSVCWPWSVTCLFGYQGICSWADPPATPRHATFVEETPSFSSVDKRGVAWRGVCSPSCLQPVGCRSAPLAVTIDLGHRRGSRGALIVAAEQPVVHRERGARRAGPAGTHDAASAQAARRRAELPHILRGGTAAARRTARCSRAAHRHALCRSRRTESNRTSSLAVTRLTNVALSLALRSQIEHMHRGSAAATLEKVPSCAQSAQLVVCLAEAHAAESALPEDECKLLVFI